MNPNNASFVGNLPSYQPISELVQDFKAGITQLQTKAVDIKPTRSMTNRKLYAWIWAAYTGANSTNYLALGTITFWNNNSKVGNLPIAAGDISSNVSEITSDVVTVATVAGQNVQDSIGLNVGTPVTVNGQAQPTRVVLQPLYISGEVDQITMSIERLHNVAQCRVFMACISSKD